MPSGIFNLKQQIQEITQGAWSGQKTPYVEYLVVAGGGGGGVYWGGGGGAGGLIQGITPVTLGSSITVTVGAAGALSSTSFVNGGNGGNSVFGSVTATGGGGGISYASGVYPSGGSGGGGALYIAYGGQGISGQGNAGGAGAYNGSGGQAGGGGGGAGTVGLNSIAASSIAGNGGAGIASAISGTLTAYAGGGGGSGNSGQGSGGVGGGGAGVASGTANNGTVNTGGGGGGQNTQPSGGTPASGSGGSGIVIISYPDTYNAPSALTGTYTASTSGSGSISFNGSTDYLKIPQSTNLSLGTGDFTFECWVYFNSVASGSIISNSNTGGNILNGLNIYLSSSGTLLVYGPSVSNTTSTTVATGQWYHIAVTRSTNTFTLWKNGVSQGTFSDSGSINGNDATRPFTIGEFGLYNSGYLNGYISNVRILKGTALYTSTFTPSTIPLTPITNTQLLLSTVSGSYLADSSANSFTITISGTPSWNQLSPFATGLGYKNRVYTWTGSGTVTF